MSTDPTIVCKTNADYYQATSRLLSFYRGISHRTVTSDARATTGRRVNITSLQSHGSASSYRGLQHSVQETFESTRC